MSRGKYAAKAATRKAELEVATDLASYQRKVAQLTAENRELRERLESQQKAAAAVERRLRAERDEGTSPEIEAMRLAMAAKDAKHQEHLREIARRLGELMTEGSIGEVDGALGATREGWIQILRALGLPFGAIAPDGNRRARRGKPGDWNFARMRDEWANANGMARG